MIFGRKYKFDPERYTGTFPGTPVAEATTPLESAAEVVYCFWTGDNELAPNRLRSLDIMRRRIGVPVKLITPANLDEYILPGHPLHRGFKYLSLVHRSDYLRCYFMHHHGGGYADIKRYSRSWKRAFDRLNRSGKWGLGYKEVGKRGVVNLEGAIGADLKSNWRKLIGNGSFIFRPHTPMTHEWYGELLRRMDLYFDELERHPGDTWGKNDGYPIPWSGCQGNIFHPLTLKYHDRLLRDNRIKPALKNYR